MISTPLKQACTVHRYLDVFLCDFFFVTAAIDDRLFVCVSTVSTRMGKDGVHPGTAYTFVTPKQASAAGDLAHHLEVTANANRGVDIVLGDRPLLVFQAVFFFFFSHIFRDKYIRVRCAHIA